MKKTVLVFGLISGVISASLMLLAIPFEDRIGYDRALIVGYTTIVLSFLLVFFGIRSYRENVGGGEITFARGFGVGILITLISCVLYVAAWEVAYYFFMPDFFDRYGAHLVEKSQAEGASQAKIDAEKAQMEAYKKMYANPLINGAMTFIEPFPVGLGITLLSAAVLRKKAKEPRAEAVTQTN